MKTLIEIIDEDTQDKLSSLLKKLHELQAEMNVKLGQKDLSEDDKKHLCHFSEEIEKALKSINKVLSFQIRDLDKSDSGQ